jgi:hypothetical protein
MAKKSLLKNGKDVEIPIADMEVDFIEAFSVLRKMQKDHGMTEKQLLRMLKRKLTN